jgi:hypothetical protein
LENHSNLSYENKVIMDTDHVLLESGHDACKDRVSEASSPKF